MFKLILRSCALFGFLILHTSMWAQETNYWFNTYGANSTLKGGIVGGETESISAIYYNPAALIRLGNEYFEGQADIAYLNYLHLKNAGGQNVNLNVLQVDVSPTLFAFSKRLKSKPHIAYGLGLITKSRSSYNFGLDYENKGNYVLPNNEEEIFQGQYKYDNRIRESWLVMTWSFELSEKLALGFSTNAVIRTQDYIKSYNAIVVPNNASTSHDNMANHAESQELDHRVIGINIKPALNYKHEDLSLGLVFTSPTVNLGMLNNQSQRAETSLLPDMNPSYYHKFNGHKLYKGVYKTPFSVSLGASYDWNKLTLNAGVEWFAKIDAYDMIEKKDNSEDLDYPIGNDPLYAIPRMANKSITNFGVGVSYEISETLQYAGSFRTDFNFFDDKQLDRQSDYVPNMSYWDIYHVTSGFILSGPRTDLTLGLNYAFGQTDQAAQFVNMTDARQDNFFRGNIQNNVKANYAYLSFTVGFNFNIDIKRGLKREKL